MTATTANDRAHDLLPATPTFTAAQPAHEPTPARPFGLAFVTDAPGDDSFDPAELVFDEEAQIVVALGADGQINPSWKHTSTTTSTNTGVNDSTAGDSDTDTADS
jgi:putative ATP-grasp target RiPP